MLTSRDVTESMSLQLNVRIYESCVVGRTSSLPFAAVCWVCSAAYSAGDCGLTRAGHRRYPSSLRTTSCDRRCVIALLFINQILSRIFLSTMSHVTFHPKDDELSKNARALVADGKGLLAADESIGSVTKCAPYLPVLDYD